MQRLRMKFAKEDGVRFLSHLETVKTFERALRRARLPLVFSQGFNPHPRFAFASALAVGVSSDGEYLDVELGETIPPDEVAKRLQAQLPQGFVLETVKEVPAEAPALMAVVDRARYRVELAVAGKVSQEDLDQAIAAFLARSAVVVERKTPKGLQAKDIRPGVFFLEGRLRGDRVVLEMLLLTGSKGNIRPEDVVQGLAQENPIPLDWERPRMRRTGLFVAQGDGLRSPMEAV